MRAILVCTALMLPALVMAAEPVEQTPYGRAAFRIEARPGPQPMKDATQREALESALAAAGVDGRWISIVDPLGRPYLANDFLPPVDNQDLAENELVMKAWVAEMHARGQAVMSWYALSICQSANLAHPDWRQVSVVPWYRESEASFFCCHMTPYGDALINYCIDAIERLQLDGIWFDGAAWTPIWNRPLPVTCFCDTCRSAFRKDTGLDLPTVYTLDDPTFRVWVQWRYGQFGEFIARAAQRIRAACPHAAVVINHYHRPGIPWHSAIPVDRYPADIITGSEAFSPVTLDLTQRLNRAYGRSQSEVWRAFDLAATPELTAENLLPHALHSYVAGGRPSFGGDHTQAMMAQAAALMSPVMRAITPHVGGPALPHVALHVSQQSETFAYARAGSVQNPSDFFWNSLGNWTWALVEAHVPPTYVFDADFTPERLAPYDILLMPLSPALSPDQVRAALEFARRGGVLVLGPGVAQLDPFGEPVPENALAQMLGFRFTKPFDPENLPMQACRFQPVPEGESVRVNGVVTPAALSAPEWQPLYVSDDGNPGIARCAYGAGHVILVTADPSHLFGSTPAAGGDTRLDVTQEQAAAGTFSLRFVDGPVAAQTFYPDLENNVPPFGTPECAGGRLECDLLLQPGAHLVLELRSHQEPILGPSVSIGPDGLAHLSHGGTVPVPVNEWFRLGIDYSFAAPDKPATCRLQITRRDGTAAETTGRAVQDGYHITDWLVLFGPGTQAGQWYVDNLRLSKTLAAGHAETSLLLDFEEGQASLQPAGTLVAHVASILKELAPPPVMVDAPGSVHAGIFEPEPGRVLVHLYDLDSSLAAWRQPVGAPVRLSCAFPVAAARLPLTGQTLEVQPVGDRFEIEVPSMGLYQVVEILRSLKHTAYRSVNLPDDRLGASGFRIARTVP